MRETAQAASTAGWSSRIAYGRGHRLPGANDFADRSGLHLPHDTAAMELDGDLANAEIKGDLLIKASARHLTEDLTFTSSERRQPLGVLLDEQTFLSASNVFLDRGVHCVEQRLVAHGLGEEVHGAELHGLYTHGYVAMPSEKNDGRRVSLCCDTGLEIEAACSWHPHIENKTARPLRQAGIEQISRRGKACRLHSCRKQELVKRFANSGVVIDDHDKRGLFVWLGRRCRCSPDLSLLHDAHPSLDVLISLFDSKALLTAASKVGPSNGFRKKPRMSFAFARC